MLRKFVRVLPEISLSLSPVGQSWLKMLSFP
jgi:hypothetical protein